MSKYRKKFAPTKDGFQEVWDSMQDPTIEQIIAGVQAHKPTKAQLLEKIKYFRDSRSTIDIELNRLAEYQKTITNYGLQKIYIILAQQKHYIIEQRANVSDGQIC